MGCCMASMVGGCPGQANNFAPLKTDILLTFWVQARVEELF
jgi:hypothetical protein